MVKFLGLCFLCFGLGSFVGGFALNKPKITHSIDSVDLEVVEGVSEKEIRGETTYDPPVSNLAQIEENLREAREGRLRDLASFVYAGISGDVVTEADIQAAISAILVEDDSEALAEMAAILENEYRSCIASRLARALGRRWAEVDPDAALEWSFGLDELSDLRFFAIEDGLKQLVRTDPRRAFEEANAIGRFHSTVVPRLYEEWLSRDPKAAAEALFHTDSLKDPETLAVSIELASRYSPELALQEILRNTGSVDLGTEALANWVADDPDAVYRWLNRSDSGGFLGDENRGEVATLVGQIASTLPNKSHGFLRN